MKVIYESRANSNLSEKDQIDRQITLLQYMKEGYTVELLVNGNWCEKKSLLLQVKNTSYRVIEKPKEVTVYTIIYWSKAFGIVSWSTQCECQYKSQLSTIDQLNTKLLKTHVDKVVIS